MSNARKIFNIAIIVIFVIAMTLPTVIWLAGGEAVRAEEADTSETDGSGLEEKRELASFPSKLSDAVLSEIESYYNDHAPFRTKVIALEKKVSIRYDTWYRNKVTPKLTEIIIGVPETPPDDATAPPAPTFNLDDLFGTPTPTPTIATPTPDDVETPSPTPTIPATPTPPGATPCPHDFGSGTTTIQASCTTDGRIDYTCSLCGEAKSETVSALGHAPVLIKSQTADEDHYGYKAYRCSRCGTYSTIDIANKTVSTSFLAPQVSSNVVFGRRDWLFYTGDSSIQYYQGANMLTESEMQTWKASLEALKSACDAKGIQLVVMAAPNKEQTYPEYMPTYNITNSPKREEAFLNYMRSSSSVNYLYPLAELNAAKLYYDVFYKQDTHWNSMGGFIGSMAVYRALGMQTTNILELNVSLITRRGGDLSNFCGFSSEYTDFAVTYKPEITSTCDYLPNSTVGSSELQLWKSNAFGDRAMLLLGDSFRHSMAPYLAKDFSTVTVAHRSDYNHEAVQSALSSLKSGDVLFLLAVERYDSANIDMANTLTAALR